MSIPEFNPARRAALRELLAETVSTTAHPKRRPPRWAGVAAFALAGILTGGAVSAAAATFGMDPPPVGQTAIGADASVGLGGVPAPAGTTPGAPIISLLGVASSFQIQTGEVSPFTASQGVVRAAEMGLASPAGATHVRVTVQCLTPGTFSWGLDAGGNNPSLSCTAGDIGAASASSYMDFVLSPLSSLYIGAEAGTSALVTVEYVAEIETAWGVNADGKTYGTAAKTGAGEPDLVAVTGRTPDGQMINGYARADELNGTQPTSPADAAAQSEAHTTQVIPVYESDGRTQIGTFTIS